MGPDRRRLALLVAAWVVVFGAAVALSIGAAARDRLPGDQAVMDAVQGLPGWLEPIAEGVRAVTATEVVLVVGVAAAAVLWFTGHRGHAAGLAAGLVVLPLLQAGIKDVVDRPRPDPALVDIRAGFSSPSFPSGHVMSGTYLYGYLLAFALLRWGREVAGRGVAAALAVVILLNGFANVYEGVHWPSDVVGGYLWAAVLLVPALAGARVLKSRTETIGT